ncbi:MAG TPA: anion permease [Terriglobales bacterium]|nr:anion permease [Terriglobales bacterium]
MDLKGVATLFGSGITDYRKALRWATVTTLSGSMLSALFATRLISVFQGKGLLPAELVQSQDFLMSVVVGAAIPVLAATRIGMPISTTHSLTGALLGSGVMAVGFHLNVVILFESFFLPLLISPLLAVASTFVLYPLFRAALRRAGMGRQACICIGNEAIPAVATSEVYRLSNPSSPLRVIVDQEAHCMQRLTGSVLGVNVQKLMDYGHYFSAGAVSFARSLNDTPRIVALGLAAGALGLMLSVALAATIMAIGGLLNATRVADTVSQRITAMEPDQGFLANLVTSFLVLFASKWGMPVSTTHVSCGSLFGIGAVNGRAQWGVIRNIVLAWVLTLPFAAVSAGSVYLLLSRGVAK